MWKRYTTITIAFLLITVPGALNNWMSLYSRFLGEDKQVTVNIGNWYEAIFPVLGLLVLLFGFWWILPQKALGVPASSKTERIFAPVTPEYIVNMCREYTDALARPMIEQFTGKWLRVSGVVINVYNADSDCLVYLEDPDVNYMAFSQEPWKGHASIMPKGHEITAVGRIKSVDGNGVILYRCELQQS